MVSENIVRDRTLVLRVLVPGLHTQLSDKLLAKQEGADNNNNNNNTLASSSNNNNPANNNSSENSGGGNNNNNIIASSSTTTTVDQVLNLEGVTCLPSSAGSTLWHFRCDGATYPARLVNLPCPVEVHKTYDHATYHKSADIGQMLIVYEDEYAMEEAENEKGYKIEGFPSYYHSGLSPPMKRVVQRRFKARFEERESKAIPPPHKEVAEVEKEIQELITQLSAKPGKQKGRGRGGGGGGSAASSSATVTTKEKVIEEVEDEIVDYEPWMEAGKIYTIEDAKKHPEWWLTKDEMKEIESAKKAEEEEEQRRAEKAEEKKKRKKEKKKKKEEEKQQQQHQQQAAAAAASSSSIPESGTSKKKGIPSLNARLPVEAAEAIDEDLDAAVTIMFHSGQTENEEDLFLDLDNEFDFANEDIGSLL
jgi:transcription initiation factor TFIID subunit 7